MFQKFLKNRPFLFLPKGDGGGGGAFNFAGGLYSALKVFNLGPANQGGKVRVLMLKFKKEIWFKKATKIGLRGPRVGFFQF